MKVFLSTDHDFLSSYLGFVVIHLTGKAWSQEFFLTLFFKPPDDVRGPFPVSISFLSILEDFQQKWRYFEGHLMPVRDFLENANFLDHKIHSEIYVPAAIQDHLAFSFMNKGIS